MKPKAIVKFALAVFVIGLAYFFYASRWGPIGSSAPLNGETLILNAGGAQAVNREVRGIFQQFGNRETKNLEKSQLTQFTKILSLGGSSIVIHAAENGVPAFLAVRVGDHWHTEFIYVVDPSYTNAFAGFPGLFPAGGCSNIWISRKSK